MKSSSKSGSIEAPPECLLPASLHVVGSFCESLGGLPGAALSIAAGLHQAGALSELAGTSAPGERLSYLDRDFQALPRHLYARSFPGRFANSTTLVRWLRDHVRRFGVVDIHGVWAFPGWHAARICHQQGVRFVIHPHGALDPFDLRKKSLLKRFLGPVFIRPMLARSEATLLTAPLEAERLVTFGAITKKLIVPLPVILPDQRGDRLAFRKKMGIPSDAQVVLFLSRIDYKKGLDFLIPALGRLKREFPRLWFVLAGSGGTVFVSKVHGWLLNYGVRRFTSEVGFVSGADKWDTFAGADIFALPSLNENFGIANIEAMHAGLPVLISDQVYLHPAISKAKAGVICQTNSASVEAKLRQLLDGTFNLPAMGRAGIELVHRNYRVEAATEALLATYREIVKVKPGGSAEH